VNPHTPLSLPSHRNFPHFNGIALWQCHSHFQLSNTQKTNCGISFLPVTVRTETQNKVAGAGEIKSNNCT